MRNKKKISQIGSILFVLCVIGGIMMTEGGHTSAPAQDIMVEQLRSGDSPELLEPLMYDIAQLQGEPSMGGYNIDFGSATQYLDPNPPILESLFDNNMETGQFASLQAFSSEDVNESDPAFLALAFGFELTIPEAYVDSVLRMRMIFKDSPEGYGDNHSISLLHLLYETVPENVIDEGGDVSYQLAAIHKEHAEGEISDFTEYSIDLDSELIEVDIQEMGSGMQAIHWNFLNYSYFFEGEDGSLWQNIILMIKNEQVSPNTLVGLGINGVEIQMGYNYVDIKQESPEILSYGQSINLEDYLTITGCSDLDFRIPGLQGYEAFKPLAEHSEIDLSSLGPGHHIIEVHTRNQYQIEDRGVLEFTILNDVPEVEISHPNDLQLYEAFEIDLSIESVYSGTTQLKVTAHRDGDVRTLYDGPWVESITTSGFTRTGEYEIVIEISDGYVGTEGYEDGGQLIMHSSVLVSEGTYDDFLDLSFSELDPLVWVGVGGAGLVALIGVALKKRR